MAEVGDIDVVNSFTFPEAEKDDDLDAETRIWAAVIPAADLSEKVAVDYFAAAVDQKLTDLENYNQYKSSSKDKVQNDETYTHRSACRNLPINKHQFITFASHLDILRKSSGTYIYFLNMIMLRTNTANKANALIAFFNK